MEHFEYQIVVQWDVRNNRYEAYSPTLSTFAVRFMPDFPKTAYGESMSDALENSAVQSKNLLKELKKLAILPPPADVGFTDPIDYSIELNDLGKMCCR